MVYFFMLAIWTDEVKAHPLSFPHLVRYLGL